MNKDHARIQCLLWIHPKRVEKLTGVPKAFGTRMRERTALTAFT
jgi:hypothetical protein